MIAPLPPKKESLLLFVLAGIQFTHIVDFMIMMPLGPVLTRVLQLDNKQFGILISAYAFTAAFSGLLAASMMDRFNRKRVILVLCVLFSGATLLCAAANSFGLLVFARALAGAFGGVLGGLVYTVIGDCIPEERRGRASGVVMGAFALSTIGGVPIGLYLGHHFGWRVPFMAVAALALVWAELARRTLPDIPGSQHPDAHPLAPLATVLREPRHWYAFGFMLLTVASSFTVIPFITLYLTANVHMLEADLWLLYFVGGAATLISSRLIGIWADRSGKGKVFRWLAVAGMLPILITTHMPPLPLFWILFNGTLFFVLVSGRMVPGMALVTSAANPAVRGTFMSLTASVQQIASGLASLGAGLIISRNAAGELVHYNLVGYIAVLLGLGAIWMSRRLSAAGS